MSRGRLTRSEARRRALRRARTSDCVARAMREFRALCSVVLQHVDRRVPRRAMVVFQRVWDDYGSCTLRRLWRALRALRLRGAVVRHVLDDGAGAYVRGPCASNKRVP